MGGTFAQEIVRTAHQKNCEATKGQLFDLVVDAWPGLSPIMLDSVRVVIDHYPEVT